MVDILKITSPISIKNKVQNVPSKLPTDAAFDILNPTQPISEPLSKTKVVEEESGKQSLLKNLNKEIFEPLLHSTGAQADGVRKLVLLAKLFESSNGILSESFLDRVFVKPEEMLGVLLTREKGATMFSGEFFDSLRMLAKLEGQPKLRAAVVSILKYFDCYVNQDNSLQSITNQSRNLARRLSGTEAQTLQEKIDILSQMIKLNRMAKQNLSNADQNSGIDLNRVIRFDRENQAQIKTYLKNDIIPELGRIAKRHQGSEKIYNQVMSIVHNIVRYDKADPRMLEEAVFQLGDDLKPLTKLSDADITEMKKLVFDHAMQEQELGDRQGMERKFGLESDKADMAALLSKALDRSGPSKISSIAQNLLLNLVQSESPMAPMMHFTIPFRYMDENTYGEFFVDKDCKERKGEATSAKNIFFTIRSDRFGNFEVDLLARDNKIDLDIRCPDLLVNPLKETRLKWKEIIEDQGFRLSNYQVGVYQEGQTIAQRFPKLAIKKVGIDVKV